MQPQPLDAEAFIRAQVYDVRYARALPPLYDWPADPSAPRVNMA